MNKNATLARLTDFDYIDTHTNNNQLSNYACISHVSIKKTENCMEKHENHFKIELK